MRTVKLKGQLLEVEFPYDPKLVTLMHQLQGKYQNEKGRKWWTLLPTTAAVKSLMNNQFDVEQGILALSKQLTTNEKATGKTSSSKCSIKKLDGWKTQPRKFQLKGISFFESMQGRALLADEQGLGKTVQAIGYMWLHRDEGTVVVVCPASVKHNWKKEIRMWTGVRGRLVEIVEGGKSRPRKVSPWIIIINYDVLPKHLVRLTALKPRLVVLDEIHYIKSKSAKRTKAAMALCKSADGVIGLSGTPVLNRPVEIFNTLTLLRPGLFPSFFKYGERYCGAYHNGFGWDFNGTSHVDELREILTSSVMLRRTKKQVLKELPDKTRSIIPMDLTNRAEYKLAEDNFLEWMEASQKTGSDSALAQIEALKQLCVKGKMEMALGWIEDFLESGEKLVVFAHHKEIIIALEDKFHGRCVTLDGSTPNQTRQEVVNQFQTDDDVRLFIGNIKAAGVGITLTAASNVCFLELPWTPADLDQAEDRLHRIGQKAAVNCWYLLAEDTVEDKIMAMLDRKRKVVDQLIDGRKTDIGHLMVELFKAMKEGKE